MCAIVEKRCLRVRSLRRERKRKVDGKGKKVILTLIFIIIVLVTKLVPNSTFPTIEFATSYDTP